VNPGRRPALRLSLALTAVAALAGSLAADPRRFTDTQGREIVAEVVGGGGATVRLRRDDGRVFEVKLETLSEPDRRFVASCLVTQAFADGTIKVEAHRVRTDSERTQTRTSTRTDEQWCYVVTFINGSGSAMGPFVVEYRMFYLDDTATADRSELPLRRRSGRLSVGELAPGSRSENRTASVLLQTTKRRSGSSRSSSGKRRIEDELAGVWVRVIFDGAVVHELASPSALPNTQAW
jgi:hypothetical protein